LLRSHCLARARRHWRGVGDSALAGGLAAMLGHWRRIGAVAHRRWGVSSCASATTPSRAGALEGRCGQGISSGALVGWWRCRRVGAGTLMLEGEGPDNQDEVEGGTGETITSWGWGGGYYL
jgi:hypothetical protein